MGMSVFNVLSKVPKFDEDDPGQEDGGLEELSRALGLPDDDEQEQLAYQCSRLVSTAPKMLSFCAEMLEMLDARASLTPEEESLQLRIAEVLDEITALL